MSKDRLVAIEPHAMFTTRSTCANMNDIVRDRKEPTVGTLSAFDTRLLADAPNTSMRSMSCSATRSRPVVPFQVLHARELLRVGGHKCRAASSGLAGEQDIIGADRPTRRFELGANSARDARIVFIEESPLEWAAEERLEPLSVTVLPLALRNAVPQLECNDRR